MKTTTKTTARRAQLTALRAMKVEALANANRMAEQEQYWNLPAISVLELDIQKIDAALATERVGRL